MWVNAMNKLYVIGIGPGSMDEMTVRAQKALSDADVIAGYEVYVDLVRPHFPDKEYITTPMRKEADRCEAALEAASRGCTVAVICSGDAGIYGMAGLIYEMAESYNVDIEVIPGVTAALSGAALIGAPLGHDCALISLSDLLTPWEKIEKRLLAAASSDMCIAIYNPSSKKRADYLKRACDILLSVVSGETVCGICKNISRDGESVSVTTLSELAQYTQADMFTTVFIGNSETRIINGKMVTPRGYRL